MPEKVGRIPPNDQNAENELLGMVLQNNSVLEDLISVLSPQDFYVTSNSIIWEAIMHMHSSQPGVTIDLSSLSTFLRSEGLLAKCGGNPYLATLVGNSFPVSANASYYSDIIKKCSIKRQLYALSLEINEKAFNETEDAYASIELIEQKLSSLGLNIKTNSYKPDFGPFLQSISDNINDIMSGKKTIGISSGFRSLDSYIGAFKPGEMSVIAARPNVGKTALALSIAQNIARHKNDKVGFFSLEMSGLSLMERLIAREGSINAGVFRSAKITQDEQSRILTVISAMYEYKSYLLIQDIPNLQFLEIKSQSRRMVKQEGVKIIFIDYISLIEHNSSSSRERFEIVAEISRGLKSLARELEVPIVCLAQVNREAGKKREPILADLRESGAIEQDADLVILLDDSTKRLDENDKVAMYEDDGSDSGDEYTKKIKVIVAKQRNGKTGAFNLAFKPNYCSFLDFERNLEE